jgi:hypothetical protein
MAGLALLDRIDQAIRELHAIRAEVASLLPPGVGNGLDETDDLAPDSLLDTHAASARFGYSRDSIARWAREGAGIKQGGRWLVSIPRLQRRLNGK